MKHGIAGVAIWVAALGLSGGVQADDRAELARVRAEITALIGPAHCANLVNCRVAPLGLDSCGPAEYIAYSWRSTDKEALDTKIAEYNLLYEDVQKAQPRAGACATMPEPVAACVNGRCVINGKR